MSAAEEGSPGPASPGSRRRALIVGGIAAAVVVLVAGLLLLPGESKSSAQVAVGKAAPVFTAPTIDGGRLDVRELRGQPLLVNFWGSWCVPCRAEFPRFAALHASGVPVLGVLFKDKAAPALAFTRSHDGSWPSVLDPKGEVASAYGVTVAPTTFVLDRQGIVRGRVVGEASEADLEGLLRAAAG